MALREAWPLGRGGAWDGPSWPRGVAKAELPPSAFPLPQPAACLQLRGLRAPGSWRCLQTPSVFPDLRSKWVTSHPPGLGRPRQQDKLPLVNSGRRGAGGEACPAFPRHRLEGTVPTSPPSL